MIKMVQFRKRKSDGQAFQLGNKKPRLPRSGSNESNGMKIGKGVRVPKQDLPDPIGDITGIQRKLVEDEIGSPIESVTDGFTGDNLFTFENGEEWFIFDSFENAEKEAQASVRNDLEQEPDLFNKDFLDQHQYISETDRRMIAQDLAESRMEGATDELRDEISSDVEDQVRDEIKGNPKKFGLNEQDIEDESDEYTDVFDKEVDEELERQLDEKMDDKRSEIIDEIEEKLEDNPRAYLVNEEGLYSDEDYSKLDYLQLDIDDATEDAVSEDGVAHFLAQYDGDEKNVRSKDGKIDLYLYRRN